MALVLLEMKAERFHALDKAVRQNDPKAMEIMQSWWSAHPSLECYDCGSIDVPRDPVYSMILPSYTDVSMVTIAPMCRSCMKLPTTQRFAKCLVIWKKMAKARTGKHVCAVKTNYNQPHPT